jgi:nitronate monooxygenase
MQASGWVERLGARYPVMLAPMAGGPSTPELVAAVSNAGGLGFLGAAYLAPDQIAEAIRRTRALTEKPFGVNLFAGGYPAVAHADAGPMLALLSGIHLELGLPPPTVPELPPDPFPEQLEVVLDGRPAVFSFTFGIPPPEAVARLRARGIAILGTATTVKEARMLADAGVDAVVAQGAEAGGHRGTFSGPVEAGMIPTLQLVKAVAQAVPLPVVASGGIMDGRDIRATLQAGAVAAQLGTAFLACPESGASEAYKKAILSTSGDRTVLTRAFSGRAARGLANAFITRMEGHEEVILPYPLQNALTRPMRTAAAKKGDPEFLSLWAGQGVARARPLPAGELVSRLVEEMGA